MKLWSFHLNLQDATDRSKQSLLNHFATFEHIKLVLWNLWLGLQSVQHLGYNNLWIFHAGQIKGSTSEQKVLKHFYLMSLFLQCLSDKYVWCFFMWEEKVTCSASHFQVVCWWSSQMVLPKLGENETDLSPEILSSMVLLFR